MSEEQTLLPSPSRARNARPSRLDNNISQWRQKLAHLLETKRLHSFVIVLIVIDAACVLADLTYTVLSEDCGGPSDELPQWLEVLAHISLVITSFFMIEIPLSLWAFGPSYFNPFGPFIHAGLHIFDAIIILTTFVLEVALKGRERELAGLLVILRMWRLVKLVGGMSSNSMVSITAHQLRPRLFEGVAVGAGEIAEETAVRLSETLQELHDTNNQLSVVQNENYALRQRLAMVRNDLEYPTHT
ncbi:hypothetical protein H0H81_006792 [Sphagnurus paluster]|uniref:Voltage-gated hydrogen channel 1 n=1 Tax=Sphagnurus paluster TaxID=117069 RepID=A0A9P7FR49_9AGAR|nr:hypothetical protein H0H81_006792 [Sphagnurus paluster]